MPQDGKTRIVTFKDSMYTLPNNPNKIKFAEFFMNSYEGSNRKEIIIYDGNLVKDIDYTIYPVVGLKMQNNLDLYVTNNIFKNISGPIGGVSFQSMNKVIMINNTFQNSTDFGFALIRISDVDYIEISQLYINYITAIGSSSEHLIYFKINEGSILLLDLLYITNSIINDQKFLYWDTIVSQISLTNSKFENLKFNSQNSLINIDSVEKLILGNLTFTSIQGDSEDSFEIYILFLSKLILDGSEDSSISNIEVINSQVGLLNFYHVQDSPSTTKMFTISDLSYLNCDFKSRYNLIAFNGIETNSDLKITLTRIIFQNVSFYFNGNLIYMKSQMQNQLEIQDLYVYNVTGGNIWVQSFNKQNLSIQANIKLSNLTTKNVDSKYSSFIQIYEGGLVEIIDSSFKNTMSLESGSVLTAGYQKVIIMIYNTVFQYNSASNGAVFNIQSESLVKLYNCTIMNNFALEGGVMKVGTNGLVQIFNSTISQNYALSVSIAEMTDIALPSILSSSYIYDNVVISNQVVLNEINKNCSNLWFLQDNFKGYLNEVLPTLSLIKSDYWIQMISAGLQIENNTNFKNQSSVLDVFSSSLAISNSSFVSLTPTSSCIKITNSSATFQNITANSINSSINSSLFISISLGSIVDINGLNYSSSMVSFLNVDSSYFNISNFILFNVKWHSYVISWRNR